MEFSLRLSAFAVKNRSNRCRLANVMTWPKIGPSLTYYDISAVCPHTRRMFFNHFSKIGLGRFDPMTWHFDFIFL